MTLGALGTGQIYGLLSHKESHTQTWSSSGSRDVTGDGLYRFCCPTWSSSLTLPCS